ncbi:MAG: hypothetical protein KGL12_01585 [Rhodospirillales bacterium]|nr:hypothetical protein [Rhodospirillales bacterium]
MRQTGPAPSATASPAPSPPRAAGPFNARAGFVACAVAMAGLVGLMGTYAAPVPLARALIQATLISGAAAATDPDAAFAKLTPELEPEVATALALPGPPALRAARAETVLAERAHRQGSAIAARLRLLLIIVTLLAALLGGAIGGAGGMRRG